jgi:copper chaperone CopZ
MQYALFSVRSIEREYSIACVADALSHVPGVRTVTIHVVPGVVEVAFDTKQTAREALLRAAAATGHVLCAVTSLPADDHGRPRAAAAQSSGTSDDSSMPPERSVRDTPHLVRAQCRHAGTPKNMTKT